MTTKLKAVYSVTEVAEMFGLSVHQTLRRLKAAGVVENRGRGKKNDVTLTALQIAFPEHLSSAVLVARLKR